MLVHIKTLFRKQQTICKKVVLKGAGLHTGEDCLVEILPAEEFHGIIFQKDGVKIQASADHVTDTSRSTSISKNGVTIRTVEHLLASLSGMKIDNAFIQVQGEEIPAFDGSAQPFCEAILAAGITEQNACIDPIILTRPFVINNKDSTILALPSDHLQMRYFLDYNHHMIGSQSAVYRPDTDYFVEKIALARTFVLYEEVQTLRDLDLARGGSLDNVIVIWPDKLSSECRISNEFACHKLLDLIGDMSLAGPVIADIIAIKSGHALNTELALKILNEYKKVSKGALADA